MNETPEPTPTPSSPEPTAPAEPPAWRGWALFLLVAAATVALVLLGISIWERRREALPQPPRVPIAALEPDSSAWGVNYPRQYHSYRRMEDDTTHTRYGGSGLRDYLEETPAKVILFAGSAFARDYLQPRGHVYAVEDVVGTARVGEHTPATCWTCKTADAPRMIAEMGAADFYAAAFHDLREEMKHPIGCADCHDSRTMELRITRPALREAFERQGRDIDRVSHQEMRSLVCAQCHVEYYFDQENYLIFPWEHGVSAEQIEYYFEEREFRDWTHAISGAPMIKIQHPDYEVYTRGIHAYRNVSCADCHMPYRTEGAVKFTNHHIRSPLLDVSNSCAVCHRWGEDEIVARVEAIQDSTREARYRAEEAIALAHFDVAAAAQAGADDEELAGVRQLLRQAQYRWDFVAAHNGMGFHAPQECMRLLGAAVDLAGQCRVDCARILARYGVTEPVQYPDFGTKEAAHTVLQAFLDGEPPALIALP